MATDADRLPSGAARLEEILGGGLLEHSITVLAGAPGTGKSLLANQYLFANATVDAPALYVSTVSEPLDKTVRFAQTLSFFRADAVGRSVFYEDGGALLRSDGIPAFSQWLARQITERAPALLVIDSFRAIASFAERARDHRAFLYDLAALSSAAATTSLWIGEYTSQAEVTAAPEAAVADAIVHLATVPTGQRQLRLLQVLKLRGSAYASGQHAYRLGPNGMQVFPRLADPAQQQPGDGAGQRVTTGLDALDQMLGGGYPQGSSTLVAGPTGSAKTLLGLQFLAAGAAAGEPGVVATLQDRPGYISQRLAQIGHGDDDSPIATLYRSPVDVYIDEWVYELLDTVEATGSKRVLVDGIPDLQLAADDPVRFREYLSSLVEQFARRGVTAVMTHELPLLFRVEALHTDAGVSNLTDTVILLQFLFGPMELKRALTVLKTQGARNDLQIRQFSITDAGIEVGPPLAPRGEMT